MPPDDPERSELDEALFGGSGDRPAANPKPRPPDDEEDLADLDSELFGESRVRCGRERAPHRTAERGDDGAVTTAGGSGLGILVVLLVIGLGGAAYALFGNDDTKTPAKAKVVVQGSQVTRTTLRPTTTSSTTTTTSSSTTTTTVPPTTTRAPVVVPETDPPITEPPATDPPPTAPPTSPPTDPPTTTSTTSLLPSP